MDRPKDAFSIPRCVQETDSSFKWSYIIDTNWPQFKNASAKRRVGKNSMKTCWLGAVGLVVVGIAAPVAAADLPARTYTPAPVFVAPAYDWSGFYVGANGGGASSHDCWTLTSVAGTALAPTPGEGCHNATGGVAGGQAGYRWQNAGWVFGIEAQGDWADLKGSNSSLTAIIPYMNQTKVDAIGLFTGQIGYAWNNALLYVKGGAAVTDNKYSSFFPVGNIFAAAGVPFNAASDTRWGGTVGTGIEFGVATNWSVAVEYDHLFMGNPNITFPPTSTAVGRADNIGQGVDMGTVRVNYRWGGPVVGKY
jgi:outer membrane immunogenic protein